jgi:hypothetical protein
MSALREWGRCFKRLRCWGRGKKYLFSPARYCIAMIANILYVVVPQTDVVRVLLVKLSAGRVTI